MGGVRVNRIRRTSRSLRNAEVRKRGSGHTTKPLLFGQKRRGDVESVRLPVEGGRRGYRGQGRSLLVPGGVLFGELVDPLERGRRAGPASDKAGQGRRETDLADVVVAELVQ